MIEKYHASHIKTTIDAAAINVMKPKKRKNGGKGAAKTLGGDHDTDI